MLWRYRPPEIEAVVTNVVTKIRLENHFGCLLLGKAPGKFIYANKTTKITNLTISCFVEKRVSISWATSWYQDVVKYAEQSLYKSTNQFVFLKCLDKTFKRGIIGGEETTVCGMLSCSSKVPVWNGKKPWVETAVHRQIMVIWLKAGWVQNPSKPIVSAGMNINPFLLEQFSASI